MVDAATLSQINTANGVKSKASDDQAKLSESVDDFLLLLVTQLENQDPLDPVDNTEFTQQIALFSGVEQSIATNKKLDQLVSLTQASNNVVSYIGKDVIAEGKNAVLENGGARFLYELDGPAETVVLNVRNAQGSIVYSAAGDTSSGRHEFKWNGQNFVGTDMPDGVYNIEVITEGYNDSEVSYRTFSNGRVTGVNMEGDEPVLEIGPMNVPLSDILSIQEQKTTQTGTEDA